MEKRPPLPATDYGAPELDAMMTSRSLHKEWLVDLYHRQDITERHFAVLSLLKETAKQVQDLRQENINLKMVNADLTNRLALLLGATSLDVNGAWFGCRGMSLGLDLNVDGVWKGLGVMNLGSEGNGSSGRETSVSDRASPSPTSVMDSVRVESNVDRVSLPKSISVRSNGYPKTLQSGCGNSEGRIRKQKVVVPVAEKEEKPLQLEVYNQGTLKTELCNKWQESGACPYGDHCQFAHGIQELRPVLRHPRYKTEVCRMVLNGDPCPYGHRCHFRHTLTDQEKIIRFINLRSRNARNR